MSTALLAVVAVILCILFRILNVNSAPRKPALVCQDSLFLTTILKIAPVIAEPYKPTRLWGFSGHVQTIVHSIIGRVRCPWPIGERVYIGLNDGTTLTYDLYQPLSNGHEDDITVAIAPGIGNTSESVYIRTFVHFVQCHGYRCAVINHVGALGSVKVTAPRIFSYGHTDDYHVMLMSLVDKHPNTKILCVGFSLGGNHVTKYMGERAINKLPQIIGGISICQGYNAIEGTKYLLNWQNFRRFYLYIMTESMKNIILKHKHVLLSEDVKQRHNLNEREILSAATLPELDEAYTRKIQNFRSVQDLYHWSSSINYLKDINIPMVFINALDDPIVPEMLLEPIRKHAGSFIHDDDYWTKRAATLLYEEKLAIGGNLKFENNERIANDLLMDLKRGEIDEAFSDPKKFLPAQSFISARDNIDQSNVLDIIKMMPKGAVLHAHDTGIVSEDYVFNNITYRDNLYVCDVNGTLSLHFFDVPKNNCDWQLLRHIRNNKTMADSINTRIRSQLSMATADPDSMYPNVDAAWDKFSKIFMFITPMLTYKPVYVDYFYQGLMELYEDNVLYLELRSTLPALYELNGTVYTSIEVLKVYEEVTTRFVNDYPDFVGVKLIYAPMRIMTPEQLDIFIVSAIQMQAMFPNFFAGIDLVGQEDKGEPLVAYADKLYPIINKLQTFFHAGETNWYGMSADDNLIDAIMLNAKRIGHGYALLKHPSVLQTMKARDIAVEVCPISNQVLGLVKDLRNHPASIFFSNGFPVVISNDDPGLWGAKALSFDFYEAFMGIMSRKADIRALKQLAINSIKYSSMSDEQKLNATIIWTRKWSDFINKLITNSTHNLISISENIH